MAKQKKKKKIYEFGSVVTARLSKDSGCTQEVLDWINTRNQRTEDIIEAIKLKIALDKGLYSNTIKDIVSHRTSKEIAISKLWDKDIKSIEIPETPNDSNTSSKNDKVQEQGDKEEQLNNDKEITSNEIYGKTGKNIDVKPKNNPGLRALSSIRRRK